MHHLPDTSRAESATHGLGRKGRLICTAQDAVASLAGIAALPAGVIAMGLCATRRHEPVEDQTEVPGPAPSRRGTSSPTCHAGRVTHRRAHQP